jgi:purine-binding chemotaxis protein CheW
MSWSAFREENAMPADALNVQTGSSQSVAQYSTFVVAGRWYGIDVTSVQEVVRPMPLTPVPLAPPYIAGLINLRGQVGTAIDLRELFGLKASNTSELMNVVCAAEGSPLSLQVDEIGDVIEARSEDYEAPPSTIAPEVRRFMTGVYKTKAGLISIIGLESITKFLGLSTKMASK